MHYVVCDHSLVQVSTKLTAAYKRHTSTVLHGCLNSMSALQAWHAVLSAVNKMVCLRFRMIMFVCKHVLFFKYDVLLFGH